jgi:hypothetical protein
MADLTQITDYADEPKRFFSSYLNGCPITLAISQAYAKQIQDFETALFQTIGGHLLETATDSQLDDLGDLIGEPRLSRTDADYGESIRLRIRINRSNGTTSELLTILSLTLDGDTFTYFEGDLAYFRVEAYDISEAKAKALLRNLGDAKPVGVRGEFWFSTWDIDDGNSFRWGSTTSPTTHVAGLCNTGDEATKGFAISSQVFR